MFSHIQDDRARMVDISSKPDSVRRAVAMGEIQLKPRTLEAIKNRQIEKGEVLETARIAAIMAVKHTSFVIPMCHTIPITSIDVRFDVGIDIIKATVEVKSTGQTGVEMEALHGVSVALLTVWDMVKSAEKDETGNYPFTRIDNIRVLEKSKQ
ncbi:cyclic pyranopterin monophosphate synthase subunit MoaC [Candidatus Methanoperedens nitroreducens]|uniref:Probable cyclic pyranopterin monophosphate synthase n=1 Tax=Candidatus Methanoperedens nitratireducens TaxID=1392998 RepID=A0A062VC37_9EURY|nr:cyclic pyranopterin monophosphate synthase MoaC [Candidatus Methanoperedens nitroreducens]KCZ73269.1 cyclic pyranopterin monophosphate synthase subunit MoaC [Candidatus Methanoperedens nitroreducens]MDJ1422783.1 cyclic pyranopterin monophosphate synthase MoaC [Candidatus Methanoperedens sp.]